MKRGFLVLGMIALVASLSLVFTSCGGGIITCVIENNTNITIFNGYFNLLYDSQHTPISPSSFGEIQGYNEITVSFNSNRDYVEDGHNHGAAIYIYAEGKGTVGGGSFNLVRGKTTRIRITEIDNLGSVNSVKVSVLENPTP